MIRAIIIDEKIENSGYSAQLATFKNDSIKLVKQFASVEDASKYLLKFPVEIIFIGDTFTPQIPQLTSLGQHLVFVSITDDSARSINSLSRNSLLAELYSKCEHWVEQVERKRMENFAQESFFVRADFELHQIYFKNLIVAESLGDYIKFVLEDRRPLVVKMSMRSLEQLLPKNQFVRVHRSYIVSKERVTRIKAKSVVIQDQEISIGTTYLNRISEILL